MTETILIVDDEPEMVEFLEILLGHRGYQTLSAYSGKECLQQARQESPDLILLDIFLLDADGLDILQELRQGETTAEIPVIVVSGRDDHHSRRDSLEAGADDFLLKPYHPQALLDRMKELLD